VDTIVEKDESLVDAGKTAVMTMRWRPLHGRLFQTWATATGKARLPTVDSLVGGTVITDVCDVTDV